jgi:uncharacterized protein involved in response to NO
MGFRIFFFGAALFSIVSILYWMIIFVFNYQIPVRNISITQWHAHEMIYGFSMAVIAGFLLTAVQNWTGRKTLNGKPLMVLFSLWVIARILFSAGPTFLFYAGIFDIVFTLFLSIAIADPIIKSKQWKQSAVISKVIIIGVANLVFYLGALGLLDQGVFWGIYGGFYVVVGLILTMSRRIVPLFIENGVGYEVNLRNSRFLDVASLIVFVLFFISELFLRNNTLSAFCAFMLFVVHSTRLVRWHTYGIWKRPLLWSLYLSLWSICLGFLLFAASFNFGISKFIAIHAFSYGGIGMITLSMMSRVSLGHSGMDIGSPSRVITFAFKLLFVGTLCRVIMPLVDSSRYLFWIGLSQVIWIAVFALFLLVYTPILCRARVDGKPG